MVNFIVWLLIAQRIMDVNRFTPFLHHYLNLPEVDRKRLYPVTRDARGNLLISTNSTDTFGRPNLAPVHPFETVPYQNELGHNAFPTESRNALQFEPQNRSNVSPSSHEIEQPFLSLVNAPRQDSATNNDPQTMAQWLNPDIPSDNYHPPANHIDLSARNDYLSLNQLAGVAPIAPPQQPLIPPYVAQLNSAHHQINPVHLPGVPNPINHVPYDEQPRTRPYNIGTGEIMISPQRVTRTSHAHIWDDVHGRQRSAHGRHVQVSVKARNRSIESDYHTRRQGHRRHTYRDVGAFTSRPDHDRSMYRDREQPRHRRSIRHASPSVSNDSVVNEHRGPSTEAQILRRIIEVLRSGYDDPDRTTHVDRSSVRSRRREPDVLTHHNRKRSLSPRRPVRAHDKKRSLSHRRSSPQEKFPDDLPVHDDVPYQHSVNDVESARVESPVSIREPSPPRGRSPTPRRNRQSAPAEYVRGQVPVLREHQDGVHGVKKAPRTARSARGDHHRVRHSPNTPSPKQSLKRRLLTPPSPDAAAEHVPRHEKTNYDPENVDSVSPPHESPTDPPELKISGLLIDPWIDGDTHTVFERRHLDAAKIVQVVPYNFTVHWAMRSKGGKKNNGDPEAEDSALGKLTSRQCLGVFRCPNWNRDRNPCRFLERPNTKKRAFEDQFYHVCPRQECGRPVLEHVPCMVTQEYLIWKHGAIFDQSGSHLHPRPSIVKHLTPTQRSTLHDVLKVNPSMKASALRTGRPDMVGPVTNVRKISSVLGNLGRIAYELQNFKKAATRGMSAMEQIIFHFTKIQVEHPGIIRESSFGPGPIHITIQSDFMRSLSVHAEPNFTYSNNGLVTDAAMKFFRNSKLLVVVITSTFVPDLTKWMPICMTAIGGQTADHYEAHHYAVFVGIHQCCLELGIAFIDLYLATVADYSEAQRKGFILAYKRFRRTFFDDSRSDEEMEVAATALYKGCDRHWSGSVDRICKISEVKKDEAYFRLLIDSLENAESLEEFNETADDLVLSFPMVEDWISWWRRPQNAAMIFRSQRTMDQDLWDSLPETTNAQEAVNVTT